MDSFECIDTAIGGKLVTCKIALSPEYRTRMIDDAEFQTKMKRRLATELATKLIEANMIAYDYRTNHSNDDIDVVARVYVAPDNQVRFIKTHIIK